MLWNFDNEKLRWLKNDLTLPKQKVAGSNPGWGEKLFHEISKFMILFIIITHFVTFLRIWKNLFSYASKKTCFYRTAGIAVKFSEFFSASHSTVEFYFYHILCRWLTVVSCVCFTITFERIYKIEVIDESTHLAVFLMFGKFFRTNFWGYLNSTLEILVGEHDRLSSLAEHLPMIRQRGGFSAKIFSVVISHPANGRNFLQFRSRLT